MKYRLLKSLVVCAVWAVMLGAAHADEVCGLELSIAEDNTIALENEKIVFDCKDIVAGLNYDMSGVKVSADYVISNVASKEAFTAVALLKTIKVKEVVVPASKKRSFLSGESLNVDGEAVKGYIYPVGAPDKLYKTLLFDSYKDMLLGMDYSGYYAEAFSRYGILTLSQYNMKNTDYGVSDIDSGDEKFYILSDDGEERLCVVVYNLRFDGFEKKNISVETSLEGIMTRPNKHTTYGTCFDYYYSGVGLKNFYTVGTTEITFNISDKKELGFVSSTAPYFNNDGIITARYEAGFDNFTFRIGEELSKDEITKLWGLYGNGKLVLEVTEVLATVIIGMSVIYIVYSIKKRKQSGIGLDKKVY